MKTIETRIKEMEIYVKGCVREKETENGEKPKTFKFEIFKAFDIMQ